MYLGQVEKHKILILNGRILLVEEKDKDVNRDDGKQEDKKQDKIKSREKKEKLRYRHNCDNQLY